MTLKKKILFGYGFSLLLMVIVFGWAIINILSLREATDAILSENYRSILAAKNMIAYIELQDAEIFILASDIENSETGLELQRRYDAEFIQWLSKARDNITIEGELKLVSEIDEAYTAYRNQVSVLIASIDLHIEKMQLLRLQSDKIQSICEELYQLNESVMYNARDNAMNLSEKAIWSNSLIGGIAVTIALIFSFLLSEKLVKPLRKFTEASRRISAGDYSIQIPIQAHDELGILAEEFNQMVIKLNKYNKLNIEQILAEKRKSDAILSSIEDGLIVLNTNLEITGINPAARSIFNLEFRDYSMLKCVDIINEERICKIIQDVIQTGKKPSIPVDDRILKVHQGDRILHFLFSITNFRGTDGSISGIVLLLRDVTYLKEVEQLKSEFIMTASHELRTPLTSLGMSIDLIKKNLMEKLNSQEQDLLEVAGDEVVRMKTLVHELLDLSKLEARTIELDYQKVSIKTIFTSIKRIFLSQLEVKRISLAQLVPPTLPDIEVDVNKVTWVLSNLVSNALRYVQEGGKIILEAHEEGSNMQISVNDNGPGIPAEYQTKIFQKFVQMTGDHNTGSGLGLAICKEIIRAHCGTIWVDSIEGQGSSFSFLIPIKRWNN